MYKKSLFNLTTVSAIVVMPFLSLTSCDSSGPLDTGGESDFSDLFNRLDALSENPDAIAEMPEFLLEGDTFEHDVIFDGTGDFFVDGNIVSDEYGRGFQAGDAPIVVNSAGQISNTEGDSLTDNVSYIYQPGQSRFTLAAQNTITGGTEEIRNIFETLLISIRDSGGDEEGSLSSAIRTFAGGGQNSGLANRTLELAIESTGLIASDSGAIFSTAFRGENPTTTTVRLARSIEYTPTSTNQEVLDTGEISGTVEIVDRYVAVAVLDEYDGRGNVVALEATTIITVNGDIIDYDGIFDEVQTHTGTFTLSLDGGSSL